MRRAKGGGTQLAPVAVAALAIGCCAGLPLIAGLFAGLTVAVILGVGGGVIVIVAVIAAAAVLVRARRRRSCPSTTEMPAP